MPTEPLPDVAAPSAPGLGRQMLPHSLADPIRAVVVAAWLPLSLAPPGQASGAPPSRNGANAPPDNPEDADTLPARRLRRRRCEPEPDDTDASEADAQEAELPAPSGAPAPREASRGTPGTSQPGSVIAASLRPQFWLSS